jgi:hypothetical protein
LEEKNGCLKLKESHTSLRSTKQAMMAKNGEHTWTRPKNIMVLSKRVFQKSEANWKDYLKMFQKLLRRLGRRNKFSPGASKE